MNCGFRSVVNALELFNDFLNGALGEIPSYQSIENWLLKAGIVEYLDSCKKFKEEAYEIIIDESITVGSQKLLLILAAPAKHKGNALRHKDVDVLAMAVSSAWKAGDIEKEIAKLANKIGHAPEYLTSDNGRNLCKAAILASVPQHRDISHTIGLILEKEYKNRDDYKAFMEIMNKKRLSYQLTENAYLLPPKLRTISRFMNMSKWVDWAWLTFQAYEGFAPKQKAAYKFVLEYKPLVTELHCIMDVIDVIFTKIKNEGLSRRTSKYCTDYIWMNILSKDNLADGCKRVGNAMVKYINEEALLLKSDEDCHNITSDIIESTFGIYKNIQPTNKFSGITSIVLALPLYGKIKDKEFDLNMDFKEKMEAVRMVDIKDWRNIVLFDNWQMRRTIELRKVKQKVS